MGEARLQATRSELDAAKVAAAAAGAQLVQSEAAAAVLQGQLAAVQEQLAAVQQRAATDAQAAAAGFNLEFKAAMVRPAVLSWRSACTAGTHVLAACMGGR